MSLLVCTGPISSGTRLLYNIVNGNFHIKAEHRSMPQWDDFWSWSDDPPGSKYIVITRRPDISVRSALKQGHGDPKLRGWEKRTHKADPDELAEWWWRAIRILATIPGAYWMSYEALVASPVTQVDNLAAWLGVAEVTYPTIYDGNAKWLARLS